MQQVLATDVDSSYALFPDIQVDKTSSRSGERKRSGADSKGGVSFKTSRRMDKKPCRLCRKFISGRTRQPPSAYEGKQNRSGGKDTLTSFPQLLKLRSYTGSAKKRQNVLAAAIMMSLLSRICRTLLNRHLPRAPATMLR